MKKFLSLVLSILTAASLCMLTACNAKDDDPSGKPEKQAYVSLDINPAVELIVDRDNRVVSVRAENEDGQVLLYEETGIVGEPLETAIQKITDLSIRYGYLDESNRVVDTLVSSADSDFSATVLSKVNTTVTATAKKSGLSVTTDGAGAYSLLRRMDEVKKQFPDNEAVQNVTVSKFKLALSVSETGDISIDAAIALDDTQLIDMLKDITPQIEEFATATYREAKAQALATYDRATALAAYSVYSQFYMEKFLSHPTTAYYGGTYQMYASAATCFEIICDMAELTANVRTYPMNEGQIHAIVSALGMESADPLRNSNGDVTIESIEAYVDKLFKNTPPSDELEQTKKDLTEALSQAEAAIKERLSEIAEEYRPQIEAAILSMRQLIASVDGMMNVLPESVQSILNTATADLKDILDEIGDLLTGEKVELKVLRRKADLLQEKADAYLEKIKADLSEDELAEIEERKKAAVEKMKDQKKALEKALDDAETAAREYLEKLKNERKENK